MPTPKAQLDSFIDKFTPSVAAMARRSLAALRKLTPGAVELVYDNYNALVIGFCASERASDAIFSLGLYPRYVNVYFLQNGSQLSDPTKLLQGSGRVVRFIRLEDAATLDRPAVRALIAEALQAADVPLEKNQKRRLIIRAIAAKQRSRRPTERADEAPKRSRTSVRQSASRRART